MAKYTAEERLQAALRYLEGKESSHNYLHMTKKTASKLYANGVYLNKILYQDCILHGMC